MSRAKSPAAEWMDVRALVPWERNPRSNTGAIEAVARSIEQFGFGAPIVARAKSLIVIAGHTRREAALFLLTHRWNDKLEAWEPRPEDDPWTVAGCSRPGNVPVRLLDLDDKAAERLSLADNKLGELASWDEAELADLLTEWEGDDLGVLGWSADEVSALTGAWEDPFADENRGGSNGDDSIADQGVARVTVVVHVTKGNDAAAAIRAAMDGTSIEYKLTVV